MRGIIVFKLYTLHKGLFFLQKKILIEEPAVLTNLYFQLHNLLATGARPDPHHFTRKGETMKKKIKKKKEKEKRKKRKRTRF